VLVSELRFPLWPLPLVFRSDVVVATRSGIRDGPLGEPRPVAMFAVAPADPVPKRSHNQDESPPHEETGLTLWKSLGGSPYRVGKV